jgi:hypothetical protein
LKNKTDNKAIVEKTIAELTEYSKKQGFPTTRGWTQYAKMNGLLTAYQLIHYTKKSWYDIRDELGFKYDLQARQQQKLEQERQVAIQQLRETAKVLGENFTKRQYADFAKVKGYFSIGQLTRLFQGKFNNAKLAAGLPVFLADDKFTDSEIVQAIKACSDYYKNRRFSETEYEAWRLQDAKNRPQIETVRRRLGSLPKLKTMLDMDTYEIHAADDPNLTKEYCISVVKKFINEMLSNENYTEWAKKNNMPAYTTVLSKTNMTWLEIKYFVLCRQLKRAEGRKGERK